MKKITEKMQSHTIKLKLASNSLETAEEKKRNFEKSFAAAQIKQALSTLALYKTRVARKNICMTTIVSLLYVFGHILVNQCLGRVGI